MSEDWFCPSIALTTSPHETMWIVITHCSSFSKCIRRNKGKMSTDSWFFNPVRDNSWTWMNTQVRQPQDQISCLCVPIRTKTSFTDQYLPIPATATGPSKCLGFVFFYSASPAYLISTSWRSFVPINVTKQKFSMCLHKQNGHTWIPSKSL